METELNPIFISYSHTDSEVADQICDKLDNLGIGYFRDVKNIEWGSSISSDVTQALSDAIAVLVIVSPASVKSQWVPYEIGYSTAKGLRILPYFVHPSTDVPGYMSDLKRISKLDELTDYFSNTFNADASKSSPLPDLKLVVQPSMMAHPTMGMIKMLSITAQNHSDIPVFLGNFSIKLDTDTQLMILTDGATGRPIQRKRLEPGEAYGINITRETFEGDNAEHGNMLNARVVDDIGREYLADADEFAKSLAELMS